MDRLSNTSKSVLDPRQQGSNRSPPKRNASTPLKDETVILERERVVSNGASGQLQELYSGVDSDGHIHKWRKMSQLGKGTFSTVILGETVDNQCPEYLRRVAIKIVILPHHRESRKRIESSLRRELEILKFIRHTCITRLLAMEITQDRYCLVTPLSEGGDLFELAANHRKDLKPRIIRRIFAEIAIAVSYLHKKNIVHRDIKLENVLVNLTVDKLLQLGSFDTTPIITLTDFGLSRTIDPNNPMLVTRCGSEDYVPPELLIGLPYDGRQTDAWALGVVLYAVMESRLPFDPPPTKMMRSKPRVAHRIARIEWCWNNFSDEDSIWSRSDWVGAKEIVEKLLVRREKRMNTEQVIQTEWVKGILPEEFYLE
jgi:protein-serine/threonine kinase